MEENKILEALEAIKPLTLAEWRKLSLIVSEYHRRQQERLARDKAITDEELLTSVKRDFAIQ